MSLFSSVPFFCWCFFGFTVTLGTWHNSLKEVLILFLLSRIVSIFATIAVCYWLQVRFRRWFVAWSFVRRFLLFVALQITGSWDPNKALSFQRWCVAKFNFSTSLVLIRWSSWIPYYFISRNSFFLSCDEKFFGENMAINQINSSGSEAVRRFFDNGRSTESFAKKFCHIWLSNSIKSVSFHDLITFLMVGSFQWAVESNIMRM